MNFSIHDKGYWMSGKTKGHVYDTLLSHSIYAFFIENNIKSVLDLGCGTGEYCSYFINHGIICDAYDGNPNTPTLTNGIGKVLDFSIGFDLEKTYDCVISVEVGEHIPKKYESIFLNNVCKHSSKWIILTWAIPGQVGDGHVNCQTNKYIIDQVEKYHFKYNKNFSDFLKNNSTMSWFKNTIMVFNK